MDNESSDNLLSCIKSLKKRIKTTAYAKFDAHKRYVRLNNTSLFSLTSASLLLIFVTIFNKYAESYCTNLNSSLIELFSLIVSIIILVLSLVVSFASYSLKSERFLRCGNEMIDLHDRLNLLSSTDITAYEEINREYTILRKHADNHKRFNYVRGRLERKKEDDEALKSKDKIIICELVEYWSPIIAFYILSSVSIFVFIFMSVKCVQYA